MPVANSSRVGGKVAIVTGAIIPADGACWRIRPTAPIWGR